MTDDELAKTIRDEAIDILVDLSGHSQGNRLRVFGQKPAPLQVTGIRHLPPGLSTIDYRLTTSVITRREEEGLFPEKPVYLDTFFAFYPPLECPSPSPSPFLEGKGLTFGCMNRLSKISPLNISVWASILQKIPDASLLVKYHGLDDSNTRDLFQKNMIQAGISDERLILLGGSTQREHLETYGRLDISLDTFPQCGGITTLESLWMGVPVLGLYEPTKLVTRGIRTLCHPLRLDDWIAEDADSLVRLALEWNERRNELVELRSGLRQRVAEVYSRFPGQVEQAYRALWRRWCAGEKAAPPAFTTGAAGPEGTSAKN
jgi:predicted O-linked N-acetylglucosamine transferase (SPINDLY family)